MDDGGPVHRVAAVGFDRAADEYERARPSYPDAAVDHIVASLSIGAGARVVDLAAGTGKLTRLLVPTGAEVLAIEPVAGMREAFAAAVPGVEVRDGTAEALPLEDGSVDAVTCAQAWHWFDARVALAEVRRVLRPGGGLAIVFNIRDESVDWIRELSEVTRTWEADRPHHRTSRPALAGTVAEVGGFGEPEVVDFPYEQWLTEDLLVDRVVSQSYVAAMETADREALIGEVRRLAQGHRDLVGRDTFAFPYRTEVTTLRRT